MPKHRVIVLDPLAQEGLDLLQAPPGIEFEVRIKLSGDALCERLRNTTVPSSAVA